MGGKQQYLIEVVGIDDGVLLLEDGVSGDFMEYFTIIGFGFCNGCEIMLKLIRIFLCF